MKDKIIWIFFEEGKQDQPEFQVEADNYKEAYRIAYENYGPQVDDLFYSQTDK
jgi:hypothetical protein